MLSEKRDAIYSHLNSSREANSQHSPTYSRLHKTGAGNAYEPVGTTDVYPSPGTQISGPGEDTYSHLDLSKSKIAAPTKTTSTSDQYSSLSSEKSNPPIYRQSEPVRPSRADRSPVDSNQKSVNVKLPVYTRVKTHEERAAQEKNTRAEEQNFRKTPAFKLPDQSYEQNQPPKPSLNSFTKQKNPESKALTFKEGIYQNICSAVPENDFSWSSARNDVKNHNDDVKNHNKKVECLDLSSFDSLKIIVNRHYLKSEYKNMRGIIKAIFEQIDVFYTTTRVSIVLSPEKLYQAVHNVAFSVGQSTDEKTLKKWKDLIRDELKLGERTQYVSTGSEGPYENVQISTNAPKR
jgi:hypothetical protein